MNNFMYYAIALLMVVIGIAICKKVAGCIIKSVITLVLVAILTALYYYFFRK